MFYSKTTGGFYDPAIHGDNIPVDAVEITKAEHESLLDAQSQGKFIQPDKKGKPVAVYPPTPSLKQAIALAHASIDKFHADTVQMLAGNPTQVEKDSWAMKLRTATEVTSNTNISVEGQSFLQAAGIITPEARAIWAENVQASAVKYSGLVGLADALRSKARIAVNAATTQAELDAAIASSRASADAAIASVQV